MTQHIAERKLLYSEKGSEARLPFTVRVSAPRITEIDNGEFAFYCSIDIDGLNEERLIVFGMDSMQAINLASNIESFLGRLQQKYDIFWFSGEPYFGQSILDQG